jgi:hypothetical protein
MVAEQGRYSMIFLMGGRDHFRTSLLAALLLAGTAMKGQAPAAPAMRSPVHSISPEIVQAVAKKLPKYTPSSAAKTPEVIAPAEVNESPDILRLPKLTVKAAPPTQLSDYDVLTPSGRLDLALRLHPGLRIGNIFGMNNGIALAMLAEERDVEKKAALTDTVRHTTSDNGPEGKRMMRLLKAAFQRPNTEWLGKSSP